MHAHAQFCLSGDYTLEGTRHAVRELAAADEADERFVIALSDANLERYGIPPHKLSEIIQMDDGVNVHRLHWLAG